MGESAHDLDPDPCAVCTLWGVRPFSWGAPLNTPGRAPALPLLIRWSRVRVPDGSLEMPRFCGAFSLPGPLQRPSFGSRQPECARNVHAMLGKWSKTREKADEWLRYLPYTFRTRLRYLGDSSSVPALHVGDSSGTWATQVRVPGMWLRCVGACSLCQVTVESRLTGSALVAWRFQRRD
jgi:hypothetical protein